MLRSDDRYTVSYVDHASSLFSCEFNVLCTLVGLHTWAPSMEQPPQNVFRYLRRGAKILSSFQDYQYCPKCCCRLITLGWAIKINGFGHTIDDVGNFSVLYECQIKDRCHQLASGSARASRCDEPRYHSPNSKPIVFEAKFASSSLICRPRFVQPVTTRWN